jgi:hypothetical protein
MINMTTVTTKVVYFKSLFFMFAPSFNVW